MDELEWVLLFLIGVLLGLMIFGAAINKAKSKLCRDMGFAYIDKQCLDVKVIKTDETGGSNE